MKEQSIQLDELWQPISMGGFIDTIREQYRNTNAVGFRDRGDRDKEVIKTYEELWAMTARIADEVEDSIVEKLEKHGQKVRVAFIGKVSYDYIVAYLGLVGAGHTAILLDCMLPVADLLYQLRHSDADMILYDSANSDKVLELEEAVEHRVRALLLPELYHDASERHEFTTWAIRDTLQALSGDEICTILYTSGTTGQSKAVMLSHKNILAELQSVYLTGEIRPESVMLSVLPIHHVFALTVVNLATLRCGGKLVIGESIAEVLDDMHFFKPTLFCGVPMMFDAIVRKINKGIEQKGKKASVKALLVGLKACHAGIDTRRKVFHDIIAELGGNMRQFYCGGAKVNSETAATLQAYGFIFNIGYGITECSGCIAHGRDPEGFVKAIPNTVIRVTQGELQVKGDLIFKGYYKDEAATREAFTEDGWYRTGDLGNMLDDGRFEISGRVKNLIILSNGENVSSEKIEEELSAIPDIREMMVYENQGRLAVEVYADDSDIARDSVKAGIAKYNATRPAYLKVFDVQFRDDEFEKTTTKKIIRNLVTDRIKSKETDRKSIPMTPMQKQLCARFASILDKKNFGLKDNFFLCGGDSIGALEAAAEQYVGFSFTVQDLYDHPTVAELSRYITGKKEHGLRKKSILNQRIAEQHKTGGSYKKPETILLTGANGYLGVHVLYELLKRNVNVICMIRNPEKLLNSYRYYFKKDLPRVIEIVEGNITADCFGLTEDIYRALTQRVDTVVHVAAKVKHAGNYEEFKKVNVNGTVNVIEFCKKAGAVMHHTSTVSLHGSGVTGYYEDETSGDSDDEVCFTERILDIGQRYEDNVYIRSKYEAEEAIITARNEGLKANIYRIGNLTWRSRDGKFQINPEDNGFMARMRAIRKICTISEEMNAYPIDFTAVDECAAAYVALVFSGECGQIFHLYQPELFSIEELLKKAHIRYQKVEYQHLMNILIEERQDKDVSVILFYLSMLQQSKPVQMQNTDTIRSLAKVGFQWKKIDLHYLHYIRA